MNHKKARAIGFIVIMAGIFVAMLPLIFPSIQDIYMIFLCIGGIISFSGVIFEVLFIRCPHCGRMLNLHGSSPEYCPHCGEKI